MKADKNKFLVTGIAPLFIGFLLLARVELPYTIDSIGLVIPVKEWNLVQAQGGNLVSSLKDNRTGKLSSYSITAFQRGNEARFTLNPKVYQYARIGKGDTIATMYTNKDEERLVQLQGEMDVQTSELQLYSTGQKSEDVQGALDKIALAKEELQTQRRVTSRTTALYKDSLVADQEYEASLNKLHTRELEVKILESNYQSVATGGKPEQIKLIVSRIDAIKKRIRQIKDGLKDFTLVSPISGIAIQKKEPTVPAEETLISIADTSEYVLVFPVVYNDKDYLIPGQLIEVAVTGTMQKCRGKVFGVDNTSQIIDGKQAFFVTAVLTEKNLRIVPGTFLKTTVLGHPITAGQYVARSVKSAFVY